MSEICQSCTFPLNNDKERGTNADNSINQDYCIHCFANGEWTQECTMQQMLEICVPHLTHYGMSKEQATEHLNNLLPTLKRWKQA
jgi:hypothetical protein